MDILNPPITLIGYINYSYDPGTNSSTIPFGSEANYLTYQWNVGLSISSPQSHGNPNTRMSNAYTCSDVKVGDWICSTGGGAALRIVNIDPSSSDFELICTVQDDEFFNTSFNPQQLGGPSANSQCIIFRLNENGLPVILGVPDFIMPVNLQADLISRFFSRNKITQFVSAKQIGHTFTKGNVIYLDQTGNYQLAQANSENIKNIIGIIKDIGIPSNDDFTFEPLYPLHENLTLPGTSGSLIYLSSDIPGVLTATKPSAWAIPLYLQLNETGTSGLLLNRGIDIIGSMGRRSTIQIVNDIASRDAILAQDSDVVIIPSDNKTYIYDGSNWQEIKAPSIITKVNDKIGDVILTASDIQANRTATNYTTTGLTIKDHLDGIDTKLASSGSTAFKNLTDVTSYVVGDANKFVKVNTTGTGLDYGVLAKVAETGSYTDLINKPTITLSTLTDVSISTPTNDQVLKYNGTSWINATVSSSTASGDKIETGTTSVKTAEVSNVVTVNANGKRVTEFSSGTSTTGDKLLIKNGDTSGQIRLEAKSIGTSDVDLVLLPQGMGNIKFGENSSDAKIQTDPTYKLTIKGGNGSGTTNANNLYLEGGNGSENNLNGGDVIIIGGIKAGTGTNGNVKINGLTMPSNDGTNGQVLTTNGAGVLNWSTSTGSGNADTSIFKNVLVITTGTSDTLTSSNHLVIVNKTIHSAHTINLPAGSSVGVGKMFTIKDGSGSASTYNISIIPNGVETIDGISNFPINVNYDSWTVVWNGTSWSVV
jgi:hypothetical protein